MKKAFLIVPLAALLALGAGCSGSTDTELGTGTVPLAGGSSDCANPFFPLSEGYRITYRNTYTGGTPSNYSVTVTSVSGNHASTTVAFDSGTSANLGYECRDGHVSALTYLDVISAHTAAIATGADGSISGDVVPPDLHVGQRWSTSYRVKLGLPTAAGGEADVQIQSEREAIAAEDVTVPAGTFHAIKVRTNTDFGVGITPMPGLPAPAPVIGYEWWVSGKGLVKTIIGDDGSIVSEATAIRLR